MENQESSLQETKIEMTEQKTTPSTDGLNLLCAAMEGDLNWKEEVEEEEFIEVLSDMDDDNGRVVKWLLANGHFGVIWIQVRFQSKFY